MGGRRCCCALSWEATLYSDLCIEYLTKEYSTLKRRVPTRFRDMHVITLLRLEYTVAMQSHSGLLRLRSMSGRFRRHRLCRDLAFCVLQADL